ncbi:hypothetical protein [Desulfatitalea tepidiphila]|uniref:hypothetical protein n=1 Tax=Desulfatitalea tepidiphila TaxID=1185843 RepID=UPI00128ECF10|nr:hypothetical protein [Desulfatitalea tepidiphila]
MDAVQGDRFDHPERQSAGEWRPQAIDFGLVLDSLFACLKVPEGDRSMRIYKVWGGDKWRKCMGIEPAKTPFLGKKKYNNIMVININEIKV